MTLLAAIFALVLALIHVVIGRMTVLDVVPRSRRLSAAGGVTSTRVRARS